MRQMVLIVACLSLCVLPDAALGSVEVTISSSFVNVLVRSGATAINDDFSGTAIPTSNLIDATLGASFSKTQIDYSKTGGQTLLSYSLDHKRPGEAFAISQSTNSMFFSVDTNTTYELSGSYDLTGSGRVFFRTRLRDVAASSFLFNNTQQSTATTNEKFVLGETEGDSDNLLTGSLTGNLIAGKTYFFTFNSFIQTESTDSGASAVGDISLVIGTATAAVPEPTTFLVWSLLGLTSTQLLRRKRSV